MDHDVTTPPERLSHEAFALLFAQNHRRIFGYVRALVPNRVDADEVFQETCVVLWREFPNFRPGAPFLPWALAIAFNQVRSQRHRNRRALTLFTDDVLLQLESRQQTLIRQVDARGEALSRCLDKLVPSDRELVTRYYSEERTVPQVAEVTGRPVNTIYKALGRIRRTLLGCIDRQLQVET